MKFKDFQAPVLFSSTFKELNLGEKNSSTFEDAWEPWSKWTSGSTTNVTSDMLPQVTFLALTLLIPHSLYIPFIIHNTNTQFLSKCTNWYCINKHRNFHSAAKISHTNECTVWK